ncbi:MAG: rRNA pseudouridine synthase [Lachnospiraceae bacterium]|nr:rRNA pseudouridine synthase [Lachnospiraceae bacterium]
MRLDKYLADMGKGTRSQIKEAARKGRIQINGVIEKKPDTKVDPETDTIVFDGSVVSYVTMEYYMLNKPQGVVSATEDNKYQTVIDLIEGKNRKDLFPVGRLDIDTEGLLLITNDGPLAHRLLAPKKHVDKIYYAVCDGFVPDSAVPEFAEGILLPDGLKCLPAILEIISRKKEDGKALSEIKLTIREGKFHQVKRMMEAVGCPVIFLKRLTMGSLTLDETLKPGEYRSLTIEELELLNSL